MSHFRLKTLNLGQGVVYTRSPQDGFLGSTGIITSLITAGVEEARNLKSYTYLGSLFPASFPGDPFLPLRFARIRLLENGQALCVAKYGWVKKGSVFRRLSISTGMRSTRTYFHPHFGDVSSEDSAIGPDGLLARRQIGVPQARIAWSTREFQSSSPNLYLNLLGKFNSNTVTIEGYAFPIASLRFEGRTVEYDKVNNGINQWSYKSVATYDSALWKEGVRLKKDANNPFGKPRSRTMIDPDLLVSFPSDLLT
jgi:hypothetical protein